MAIVSTSLLIFSLAFQSVWALQVSPHSPCALECLDDPMESVSDPNASNTYGSDISCLDTSFESTVVGRKFKSCISCLQNSTASSSGENDQDWFLYNLRYSLSSCLFDFSSPSDAVSTPCSTDLSCGPLQESLEVGNFVPGNGSTYSYCAAAQYSFMGSSLDNCVSCLHNSGSEMYMSNFLIALKAGCQQQPPAGTNIGIQGSMFSTTLINITYPGYSPDKDKKMKHGMSRPTIIGMSVGLGILCAILLAIIFICCKKRRDGKRSKQYPSTLDPWSGAENISSPTNSSALRSSLGNPPVTFNQPLKNSTLSAKEIQLIEQLGVMPQKHTSPVQTQAFIRWPEHLPNPVSSPPSYAETTVMPIHQAYVPSVHATTSPTTSFNTDNSYQMASYSSRSSPHSISPSRTSPNNIPPSRVSPSSIPPSRISPRHIPPPIITTALSIPESNSTQSYGESSQQQPQHGRQNSWERLQPYAPQSPIGAAPIEHGQTHSDDLSPQSRTVPRIELAQPPSRTASRGTWRQTSRTGIGNVNASAFGSSTGGPVRTSKPSFSQGSRFDFEVAQRDREAEEARLRAEFQRTEYSQGNDSPEEQWPGNY